MITKLRTSLVGKCFDILPNALMSPLQGVIVIGSSKISFEANYCKVPHIVKSVSVLIFSQTRSGPYRLYSKWSTKVRFED